jgi:hypothetical protein
MKSPDQWPEIRKEAEQRLEQDLSDFEPVFVHWNDIRLDVSDPVDLVANTSLWSRMKPILFFGRRDKKILVIQVSPENITNLQVPHNEPGNTSLESLWMVREVLSNTLQYFD